MQRHRFRYPRQNRYKRLIVRPLFLAQTCDDLLGCDTAAADSGYGLAICEDVMGAMGGSISHRTQGGLFSVTLCFPILPQQEG